MKMKLSFPFLLALLFIAALATSGCSSTRVENSAPSTQTEVSLTHGNYKMVKAGAEGTSYGFRFFLGIIPITSPSTAAARSDLYSNVGESVNGRSVALINVVEDRSTTWLVLFSIPKITLTGDVVEFMEDQQQPVQQVTAPVQQIAAPVQQAAPPVQPSTTPIQQAAAPH